MEKKPTSKRMSLFEQFKRNFVQGNEIKVLTFASSLSKFYYLAVVIAVDL